MKWVEQCLRLVRGKAVESNLKLTSEVEEVPDIEADPRAIITGFAECAFQCHQIHARWRVQ